MKISKVLSLLFNILFISISYGQGYILVQQSMDFASAEAFCLLNFGTQLASIHSLADSNEAITVSAGYSVWIGLNDIDTPNPGLIYYIYIYINT